jgi:hypothetical protein
MVAPLYFVVFVLMAQFVLVNVVVAVLMKHLDVSVKVDPQDSKPYSKIPIIKSKPGVERNDP